MSDSSGPGPGPGTTGSIKGLVKSAETSLQIEGALVSLSYYRNTTTDVTGLYSFKDIEFGSYSISVSKQGYAAEYMSVIVNGDKTYDIYLDKAVFSITLVPEKNVISRRSALIYVTSNFFPFLCFYGIDPNLLDMKISCTSSGLIFIDNLKSGTKYFFIFEANNNYSSLGSFTTLKYAAPMLLTGYATNVTNNSAILGGVINPNGVSTTVLFKYGLTPNYTDSIYVSSTTFNGNSSITIYSQIINLQSNTDYHYCLKAYNDDNIIIGNDMTFKTINK